MAVEIGIVGAGSIARTHASNIGAMSDARLLWVCDTNPQRLADWEPESKGGRYGSLEQALSFARPDVILVATNESSHARLTLAALAAGCDVYCEKPLALSSVEANSVLAAAREADRTVTVGHCLREDAFFNHLSARGLSTIHFIRSYSREYEAEYTACHPAFSVAIHDFDLGLWLCRIQLRELEELTVVRSRSGFRSSARFPDGRVLGVDVDFELDAPPASLRYRVDAVCLDGSVRRIDKEFVFSSLGFDALSHIAHRHLREHLIARSNSDFASLASAVDAVCLAETVVLELKNVDRANGAQDVPCHA